MNGLMKVANILFACSLAHYSVLGYSRQAATSLYSDSSWKDLHIEENSLWHFCSFRDQYPRSYISYKTSNPPVIDGSLDEDVWQEVAWSEPFVDILGHGPVPRFDTKMKMRWDDEFLYIAGSLQEPDIWANITEDNKVIFQDNDFEASAGRYFSYAMHANLH